MRQPSAPSRRFSFFGLAASAPPGAVSRRVNLDPPRLKLESDKEVYRPGDPITITVAIKYPTNHCSLLIDKLSFECKGIEKLDSQWFNTPKQQRRVGPPKLICCASFYQTLYLRLTEFLILENGLSYGESILDFPQMEARLPLQIWVTQKSNCQLGEECCIDGIVPLSTIFLDIYWKETGADSEWAKVDEPFDGTEEGYESSKNEMKGNIDKGFESSLSLQSLAARSSTRGSLYVEGQPSKSMSMAALTLLSVAEVSHDSTADKSSSVVGSPGQVSKHPNGFSAENDSRTSPVSGSIESGLSEGIVRGRSYNIRLDDQVLLKISPKNSESTYYFSDMIGWTLTFLHEEGARRCLELSITLETKETINRRFVHPSQRHAPTITKIHSDHHEVVADLVQTSFLFSIPVDGPMTFSTSYISVQWALRFEFLTAPKNVDWTRFEHPLLIEGRDKCEWVLPITVHAPPLVAAAAQTRNEKLLFLGPMWIRT
ncbi:hypothetical protein CASFOL_012630 [Castilleja foliolosa]|uniref:Reduced growth phenotype protein 1 n=1 Tax=Castilleja foliolosa TaxID=1961234 RepID=A0ABD3DLR9_9LAMI